MSFAARNQPLVSVAQQRAWRQRLKGLIRDAGFVEPATRDWQFRGLDRIVSAPLDGPFWELDPTPLILDATEWSLIEAGLRQRAHFVNAMLVDLYDRQEVLKQGLLPPDVILGDPYYRRPCLRLEPTRDTPATLLRFDLVKTTAGWNVLPNLRQHPGRTQLRRAESALHDAGGRRAVPAAAGSP